MLLPKHGPISSSLEFSNDNVSSDRRFWWRPGRKQHIALGGYISRNLITCESWLLTIKGVKQPRSSCKSHARSYVEYVVYNNKNAARIPKLAPRISFEILFNSDLRALRHIRPSCSVSAS